MNARLSIRTVQQRRRKRHGEAVHVLQSDVEAGLAVPMFFVGQRNGQTTRGIHMTIETGNETLEEAGRAVSARLSEYGSVLNTKVVQPGRRLLTAADREVRTLVEQHPVACLVGAAGLGFVIARMVQRR